MLCAIFASLFMSCGDKVAQKTKENVAEKKEVTYPSKMYYSPKNNRKCRVISRGVARCWVIDPTKD